MPTALHLTDGSIDSAIQVRAWLLEEASRTLTVVYPYDILTDKPLHKSICQPAKAEAQAQLARWHSFVGDDLAHRVKLETVLAPLMLAFTIHILIRRYEWWLPCDGLVLDECTVTSILAKSNTRMVQQSTLPAFLGESPTTLIQRNNVSLCTA